MAEQAQVPTRIPAGMADPGAQKDEPSIDVVPVAARCCELAFDLAPQVARNPLVGIHDEHPFIAEGQRRERPVFLPRIALEGMLNDVRAMRSRDLDGPVV